MKNLSENNRALIFLILLLAVAFLPVILNWQTFFVHVPGHPLAGGPYGHQNLRIPWNADVSLYNGYEIPQTIYWMKELRRGNFAFWNPYQGNGQPLSATLTTGIYNPLKLLLFGLFPYLKTFDYYILLRFLIAGFGTYLFLKKIKISHRSALLGAVAYMFSGYFVLWITHVTEAADMMTPWILLGIENLLERPRIKQILFLTTVWATMVLSGIPEAVIVITVFSICYFLFKFFRGKFDFKMGLVFLSSLLIAFLISMPLLWDMAFFFSQGINAHGEGIFIRTTDLHSSFEKFLQIFTLPVSPLLFFEVANLGGVWKGDFSVPYIGVSILLLAIIAFSLKKRDEYRAPALFFGGTALFFILLWAGLPPVIWLWKLPILEKIIFFKYNSPFYLTLAILAAIGFENIKKENVAPKKFLSVLLAIVVVSAGLFFFSSTFRGFYKLQFADIRLEKIQTALISLPVIIQTPVQWLISNSYSYTIIIFGLTALLTALFLFLWWKKKYTLIFIFLILELLLYMPKLRDGFSFHPFKEPPFITYLKSRPDIDYYRIFAIGRTLEPWSATAFGLKDVRTVDSVLLEPYLKFLQPFLDSGYLRGPFNSWWTGRADQVNKTNNYFLPSFNMASVKYVISEEALPKDAPYKLIYDQETKIYENSGALPLAYIKTDDGKILKSVTIIKHDPNRIALQANVSEAGTLVLTETDYPGWRVFVNGEEKEILPIQKIFRGVRLTKGVHEIVFNYWPLFTVDTFKSIISYSRE